MKLTHETLRVGDAYWGGGFFYHIDAIQRGRIHLQKWKCTEGIEPQEGDHVGAYSMGKTDWPEIDVVEVT